MFVDTKRRRIYVSCGDGFLDVLAADAYKLVERIPTIKGARTSLLVPEIDRLFVAARATPEAPASIWVFRPDRDYLSAKLDMGLAMEHSGPEA
jgi:hypothetical protein